MDLETNVSPGRNYILIKSLNYQTAIRSFNEHAGSKVVPHLILKKSLHLTIDYLFQRINFYIFIKKLKNPH